MADKQLGQIYYESLSSTKKEMLKQSFIEKTGLDPRTDKSLFYYWISKIRIKSK